VEEATPEDVRRRWDALAGFWDEKVDSGGTWQRNVINPAVERLLQMRDGERVVELACGNGELARRMEAAGALVVASDFSAPMLDRARGHGGNVVYRVADATRAEDVLALGEPASFDAAVVSMAVMDMPELGPMARALHALVRPVGRLVISVLHPAFNSGDVTLVTEERNDARGISREYNVKRSTYLGETSGLGVGVEGQPVEQWHFHRPLERVVEPFFAAGWMMDALVEPAAPSSLFFADLPGVLVVRFRRVQPEGADR
jgi:SAM-dependent methyltransferase